MGQKTHPLGFRLDITQQHRSLWFANKKKYSLILKEDFLIRQNILSNVKQANITDIKIQRKINQIEISIYTARPGIILGKSGDGIDQLKNKIHYTVKIQEAIRINVIEITEPDKEASILAEFLALQLEKRIAFRRAIRQSIQKAQKANTKGLKIQISGRLNGAEIARSEWVREGRVPLQTIRANIDYAYRRAQTIYGVLGIKVWLFKGEIFRSKHYNS